MIQKFISPHYMIILFIFILFIYNIFYKYFKNIETMENNDSSCENNVSTIVYKNAGAIENLQSSVEKLSKQINESILINDKQSADLSNLTGLETKFDKLAQKADSLANDNKSRLLEMAQQAHKSAQIAQKKSDSISFDK